MLDLDADDVTGPPGMFPFFVKRSAEVLAPFIYTVFCRLHRLGSFSTFWRYSNDTPIPKGPSSSSVENYRSNSITPVLSEVFGRLVSVCVGRFMDCSGVLPTTLFAYRKGLGSCDGFMDFFVRPLHCKVYLAWICMRHGLCSLTSDQPLIESTL